MNKLEELHLDTIYSKAHEEDFDANTSGHVLYSDEFEEAATKSAEITKQISIEFIEWCNKPMYKKPRHLGFEKRVTALYPDYNVYIVIDEKGNSIFPEGKFLTTEELFEEFLKQRQ